jgi:hypothetical protein
LRRNDHRVLKKLSNMDNGQHIMALNAENVKMNRVNEVDSAKGVGRVSEILDECDRARLRKQIVKTREIVRKVEGKERDKERKSRSKKV